MSQLQSPYQTINVRNRPEEQFNIGHHYPPPSAQYQIWQSRFSDSSGPLFAMYLRIAEEQDQKRAERLKADTDQILIFCGLFSAAVAALVVPSMPDLKPPDNTPSATDLLSNDVASILSMLSNSSFYFPYYYSGYTVGPKFAVLVNSLWLLSLLISITCALLAISLQQWARRHAKVTPPRYSLPEQARMRAFFANGIETQNFTLFVEALPVLVHVSLLFFFAGFILFVSDLNNTVFAISCCWITLFVGAYGYITIMPIFRPDSPFYTPLSNPAAVIYAGVFRGTSRVLWAGSSFRNRASNATREHLHDLKERHRHWMSWGMMKFAEDKARQQTSEIDGEVLKRTLDALSEDHDLEQFFEGLPGFCDSDAVDDVQRSLDILGRERLADTLDEFWNRTLSSNQQPSAVKERRLVVCLRVLEATDLGVFAAPRIFRDLSPQHMGGVLRSVELGESLRAFCGGKLAPLARSMISGVISNVQEHDDRWFALVVGQLGVSEGVLRSYLAHGDDSVSLANLIHIARHLFQFDISSALPELQHEFCGLWNEIVRRAETNKGDNKPFIEILAELWRLYVALHPTDATPTDASTGTSHVDVLKQPASYPSCEVADHRSNLTSDAHGVVDNIAGVANRDITTSPTFPLPAVHRADSSHSAIGVTQNIADASPNSTMDQRISLSYPRTGHASFPN
ncbi:hypothetical protein BC827DRAFT_1266131 [Russula dissimulans]|nr:hypothetical protein BC827DRAFT_1266131 [Russula dissimulans]